MELPTNITVDLNQASQTLEQCLKMVAKFTGTTYMNICNSTTYFVPFGFWDYAIILPLIIAVILLIILFLKMIIE